MSLTKKLIKENKVLLRASIKKWEKRVDLLKRNKGSKIYKDLNHYFIQFKDGELEELKLGIHDCPLCKHYFYGDSYFINLCVDCCIKHDTNDTNCAKTPYRDLVKHLKRVNVKTVTKTVITLAERELFYLKTLYFNL